MSYAPGGSYGEQEMLGMCCFLMGGPFRKDAHFYFIFYFFCGGGGLGHLKVQQILKGITTFEENLKFQQILKAGLPAVLDSKIP